MCECRADGCFCRKCNFFAWFWCAVAIACPLEIDSPVTPDFKMIYFKKPPKFIFFYLCKIHTYTGSHGKIIPLWDATETSNKSKWSFLLYCQHTLTILSSQSIVYISIVQANLCLSKTPYLSSTFSRNLVQGLATGWVCLVLAARLTGIGKRAATICCFSGQVSAYGAFLAMGCFSVVGSSLISLLFPLLQVKQSGIT